MEDDLNLLKEEYLSNHWSDFPKILNLSLGDQTITAEEIKPKLNISWKKDPLQWKITSKY